MAEDDDWRRGSATTMRRRFAKPLDSQTVAILVVVFAPPYADAGIVTWFDRVRPLV
jgi:hypothetical protein